MLNGRVLGDLCGNDHIKLLLLSYNLTSSAIISIVNFADIDHSIIQWQSDIVGTKLLTLKYNIWLIIHKS
jgi:hypothetical protein